MSMVSGRFSFPSRETRYVTRHLSFITVVLLCERSTVEALRTLRRNYKETRNLIMFDRQYVGYFAGTEEACSKHCLGLRGES